MIARRLLALAVLALVASAVPARADFISRPLPLEDLAERSDLVTKVLVLSSRPVSDPSFGDSSSYEVREVRLRVVSVLEGPSTPDVIRFRHYGGRFPSTPWVGSGPQTYDLVAGRAYIVFADSVAGDLYRPSVEAPTSQLDQGVLRASDDQPHRGTTVADAVWEELVGLLASRSSNDVLEGISQLDMLSGGNGGSLRDFDRKRVLAEIVPRIGDRDPSVASAAIRVLGASSPYFDEAIAPSWLAGLREGVLPGFTGRTPDGPPAPDAIRLLLAVADGGASPALRAGAIRALGRAPGIPPERIDAWSRDPQVIVRRAAALVSAELEDQTILRTTATDVSPQVRASGALAMGFTQDPALVPVLDHLLGDTDPEVRQAAALALVSYPMSAAEPILKAHLDSGFRALFLHTLARCDPAPYAAMLAELLTGPGLDDQSIWPFPGPGVTSAGLFPTDEAWQLLFEHIATRSTSQLPASELDGWLDALEGSRTDASSSAHLYALYLSRGLSTRARRIRHRIPQWQVDSIDADPTPYLPVHPERHPVPRGRLEVLSRPVDLFASHDPSPAAAYEVPPGRLAVRRLDEHPPGNLMPANPGMVGVARSAACTE